MLNDSIDRLRGNIARVFLGNPRAIERVICCLLAKGHVLIEDVPGVGKTVLATALARSIDCSFSRIQLTPDLLPSDILGVSIFTRPVQPHSNGVAQPAGDGGSGPHMPGASTAGGFEFKRGPIFANIVLADEINRTPPRTQTALLEAMSEATVTVDGRTYPLEQPFMIVATQNPYDFEGTYMLPENQLDRFFMRIGLGYPSPEDEARVLGQRPAETELARLAPVLHKTDIVALQRRVDEVRVDPSLIEYVIDLANATRQRDDLHVGLSPRGALALTHAARATAVLQGRDYATPDDIVSNVLPVCAHRIIARSASAGRTGGGRGGAGDDQSYPPGSSQAILMEVLDELEVPG